MIRASALLLAVTFSSTLKGIPAFAGMTLEVGRWVVNGRRDDPARGCDAVAGAAASPRGKVPSPGVVPVQDTR